MAQSTNAPADRFPELAPDDQAAEWSLIFEDDALEMRVFVVSGPAGNRYIVQIDDKRLTLTEQQLQALQRFALDVHRLLGPEEA